MSECFNLISESWLPVLRRSGAVERIPPWRITDRIDDDPFVGFAWPRPDFNGAAHEFLIGLLSTAAAPEDDYSWEDWWLQPPSPEVLQERFTRYSHAFNLDGPGPRFLQDVDPLEGGKSRDVTVLLIDAPGEETIKNNADLFVKRHDEAVMCRGAAAMALFALNAYAPSGGVGHRTSVRGGGPMTTLIVEEHEKLGDTLWGRLWPNVETINDIDERERPSATEDDSPMFPWLTATRTSDRQGRPTAQPDVHPLQVYWGMPRRIRLDFEVANGRACFLTGVEDAAVVKRYRTKNYGVNYDAETFEHPLSPYYRPKEGAPHRPQHPQLGGITYRLWPSIICATTNQLTRPAQTMRRWQEKSGKAQKARVVAFGYDTDKGKARAWVESEMPIWRLGSKRQERLDHFIHHATGGAVEVAQLLMVAVKSALPDPPKGKRYGFIEEAFYRETEEAFHELLHSVVQQIQVDLDTEDPTLPAREKWRCAAANVATGLFDYYAPMDGLEDRCMSRHVKARYFLGRALRGQDKEGKRLFKALDLVPLESGPA